MGYCPQFDALLELLTVREHLELYTKIKGIPILMVMIIMRKLNIRLKALSHKQ